MLPLLLLRRAAADGAVACTKMTVSIVCCLSNLFPGCFTDWLTRALHTPDHMQRQRSLTAVAATARPEAAPPASASPGKNGQTKAAKQAYDWRDPLLLGAQLSEEERLIREMAQAYCQQSLMPR